MTIPKKYRSVLLKAAGEKYGRFDPCAKKTISECMFEWRDHYYFWFNTLPDNSTRSVKVRKDSLSCITTRELNA